MFLAYRSGSRSGNLLPIPRAEGADIVKSSPDRLATLEAGWRTASRTLSLSSTLSYTRWKDVQSDLVTGAGNYRTVNLGRTEIWGLEAVASWTPPGGWSLGASAFVNNSPSFALSDNARSIVPKGFLAEGRRLPNISSVGARGTLAYETSISGNSRLRVACALRYYGPSVAEFERRQPRYVEIGGEARYVSGRWGVTIGVTNLTDVRGNRFALGNQVNASVGERQLTPLQPRTVLLGVDFAILEIRLKTLGDQGAVGRISMPDRWSTRISLVAASISTKRPCSPAGEQARYRPV